MKKILIFLTLLITIDYKELNAAYRNPIPNGGQYQNGNPNPIDILDLIHAGYANQTDKDGKIAFINSILDNSTINLEEKTLQISALLKVIDADISMHSGWLWNNPINQLYIDWLSIQKSNIKDRLNKMEWEAKSFASKTSITGAKYITIYLGIILAAFLAQYELSKLTGNKINYSYDELAAMPIQKIIELATNATLWSINSATGPTAQKIAGGLYNGTVAGTRTMADYLYNAGNSISKTIPAAATKSTHEIAQTIANITNPNKTKPMNLTGQSKNYRNFDHPKTI